MMTSSSHDQPADDNGLDVPDNEAADTYVRKIIGAVAAGFVHIMFGFGGQIDASGAYAFGRRRHCEYAVADGVAPILAAIAEHELDADIYVVPYVLAGRDRSKGTSVQRRVVHADVDVPVSPEQVRAIGGWAVTSGRPGHLHVYLDVDRDLTVDEHRSLCRGLMRWFGAPDPKISDNDYLRLPGTLAFKPPAAGLADGPVLTDFAVDPSEAEPWDRDELAGLLDVDLADPDAGTAPMVDLDSELVAAKPEPLERLPERVRDRLSRVSGDRSTDTFRVVDACVWSGLSLPETRWVVAQRSDLVDRLTARKDDDVARCFARSTARHTAWLTECAEVPDNPSAITDGDLPPAPDTLRAAVDACGSAPWRLPETIHHVTDNVFAIVGGPRHGFAQKVWKDDGDGGRTQVLEPFTDWVAWRCGESRRVTADETGQLSEIGEPSFTVEVVRHDRAPVRVDDMTAEGSVSPARVLDVANCGVALPTNPTLVKHIANALRVLGFDEMEVSESLVHTGWVQLPGRAVWAAPRGSMSAAGVVDDVAVGDPLHLEGELSTAMRSIGWESAAEGDRLREVAAAVPKFIGIVPDRPEVCIAVLGAVFAGFLGLDKGCTVKLVADPGSGKSLLSTGAQTFWGATPLDGATVTLDIPKASVAGAIAVGGWHRGTLLADNLRKTRSKSRAETMMDVATTVINGSYGESPSIKSNQLSGLRVGLTPDYVGLMTAELLHDDQAIRQRCVILHLASTDIARFGAGNPLDTFRAEFVTKNLPTEFSGAFVRWQCKNADANDGVPWVTRTAEERKAQARKMLGDYRAGETVSVLAAAWDLLLDFAEEVGIDDVLPSRPEIVAAMKKLVDLNAQAHAEAEPGPALIAAVRGLIEAKQMHVESHDQAVPGKSADGYATARRWGWRPRLSSRADEPNDVVDTREVAGYLTPDESQVIISVAAMRRAAQAADLPLSSDQIGRALEGLVVPDATDAKGRAKRHLGIPHRPRGYVLDVATWFGGDDPDHAAPNSADQWDNDPIRAAVEYLTDAAPDECATFVGRLAVGGNVRAAKVASAIADRPDTDEFNRFGQVGKWLERLVGLDAVTESLTEKLVKALDAAIAVRGEEPF